MAKKPQRKKKQLQPDWREKYTRLVKEHDKLHSEYLAATDRLRTIKDAIDTLITSASSVDSKEEIQGMIEDYVDARIDGLQITPS